MNSTTRGLLIGLGGFFIGGLIHSFISLDQPIKTLVVGLGACAASLLIWAFVRPRASGGVK
jgi:hypothetical protein